MNKPSNKVAFYEPPPRKTSAEIINEARLAIRESQMTENSFVSTPIKPLQTQRPFTPRNKERILFGKKAKNDRPPSSFSLGYLRKEAEKTDNSFITTKLIPKRRISIPKSVIKPRSNSLSEISNTKIFNIGITETALSKIKLPSLDHKKIIKNTSLDDLPEELEDLKSERKAFSSPQERTDFIEKKNNLSQCLLLGPQNLEKIFDNKQIIEHSQTLFLSKGYLNRDLKAHNQRLSTKRTVEEIIDEIVNTNNKEERVVELLEELYQEMDAEKLLTNKVSSKLKIHILKSLYKYVEAQNERLLLNIARIILALKVTGNNLIGVCKLIFKVSKSDKNDHLFFQKNILELFLDALGRSSPLDDAEACVYGYGAIKFLTMNSKLSEKFLSLGILQLMVLHMKIINSTKTENSSLPDHTNHALFQLTGALRNIVSDDNIYETFISCGAIEQLCQSINFFSADLDIISNIARILSTISINDCCCDSIVENEDIFKVFVQIFERYPEKEDIIVRLAFTLGNIVAKIDNTRVKFYKTNKSIDSLLNLWQIYLDKTLTIYSDEETHEKGNPEDVMIKVIRIIANIVINPEIGKAVNKNHGSILITELLKVLISNPFKKNEELVMSILSTLNNLSYYYTSDSAPQISICEQEQLINGVSEYCSSENKECLIESMRILGNLSRLSDVREYIASSDVFSTILNILTRTDLTLLKTTIGVLVNLMADSKARELFGHEKGICKLIQVLKNYAAKDWILGMLTCQVIWNYCIDTNDLTDLIPYEQIQELLEILADYLDEEKLFGIVEGSTDDSEIYVTQEFLIWEEFASVATNVLEKIEAFLEHFEQIDIDNEPTVKQRRNSSTNITFVAW